MSRPTSTLASEARAVRCRSAASSDQASATDEEDDREDDVDDELGRSSAIGTPFHVT